MNMKICEKCEEFYEQWCCFYNLQCNAITSCNKVEMNPNDAKIRVRAKRLLRKHGVPFSNDLNAALLVILVRLVRKANSQKRIR